MASTSNASIQEYSIKVPKRIQKRHHVMRFNANLNIDFKKWTQVKMERENNMREFKTNDEEMPKFGAGSEFGREAKEEARRKKLGIITRKYKADDQPWILKIFSGGVKKFKGIREGGVSENASYYVFTQCADGGIEAFPLHEWYKFQPIQRYKSLSAEEAEQEFSKRNKHLNYFSLMLRKRLRGEEDDDNGEEEKGKSKKGGKSKDLKISDMDEWMNSSDESSSDEGEREKDENDEEEKKDKKKKNQTQTKKKKKKAHSDEEAVEESDDGDDEGRELDYISDSSDSEPEETKLEGVSEEKALRKLLNSDEEDSDEEEEKSEKDEEKEEDEKDKEGEKKEETDDKNKKKKKKKEVKKEKKDDKKSDDDFSSDSSTDEDVRKQKAEKKAAKKEADKGKNGEKEKQQPESGSSSRSDTPTSSGEKRKLPEQPSSSSSSPPPSKKSKLDTSINYIPGASESGVSEEAVRKYLMRKPMTTTELLQKFKSKKTGLSSDQLVTIMTQILKKINPVKQTLKGKMYLSIKS